MKVMQSRRTWDIFRLCALLLVVGLTAWPLQTVDPASLPKPTGYVSDLAHVVSPEAKNQLEQFCTQVEQQLGVQFALVTINTLHDQPIEDFAIKLARQWGVGDKKNNQGVLLLLAINDRKSDIETGRGIEPYLGDGFSGGILRSLRPDLRGSNYSAALLTAAHAMARQIAQAKGIPFTDQSPVDDRERTPDTGSRGGSIPGWLIFAGVFFLLWLLGRGGGRRGGRGGRGGGGLWTGLLLGSLLNSGGRRGGWGGSNWGGGGGFGGGSGGGGGFGGFGGGDFGGGGANSNW